MSSEKYCRHMYTYLVKRRLDITDVPAEQALPDATDRDMSGVITEVGPARKARARNRRGEGGRLREELIAAANKLLEEGVSEEALSLRAVTRHAGVAPQAFYLHFADLDSLLWAVYANAFEHFETALSAAEADQQTPAARLRARCLAHCSYATDHPASYRVLFGVVGTFKPKWAEEDLPGTATFQATLAAVIGCIDAEQARNADPFRLAVTLLGAIHGLLDLCLNKPTFPWPPLSELVDDVLVHQIGLPATR